MPNQDFGIYDQLTIRPSGDCANYISLRNKQFQKKDTNHPWETENWEMLNKFE